MDYFFTVKRICRKLSRASKPEKNYNENNYTLNKYNSGKYSKYKDDTIEIML